jgi:hypothetical protein
MRDRIMNSQNILKMYMDKLEVVLQGDTQAKYLEEEDSNNPGFVQRTILKEQRLKYRKLFCMSQMEKRVGLQELFGQLSLGKEEIELGDYNQRLIECEDLNEEGKGMKGLIDRAEGVG